MAIRKHPEGGWLADFTIGTERFRLKAKTRQLAQARMAETFAKYGQKVSRNKGVRYSKDAYSLKQAIRNTYELRWQHLACCDVAMNYAKIVVEYFGEDRPVESIKFQDIHAMRLHFLECNNKPSTVNYKASCLQCMIKDAEKMGFVDSLPRFPVRLPTNNTKDRVFSEEEEKAFVNYFYQIGKKEAAHLFTFLIEVGCRWGEAERLIGRDVDIYRKRVQFLKTKNGYPRTTPLTATALQAVTPFMPKISTYRVWGYKYKEFQYIFDMAKNRLGLAEDKALSIHCTRHTMATRMTAKGISLVQLMHWGGWKSLQAVQRYAHVDISQLEQVADKIDTGCGRMYVPSEWQGKSAINENGGTEWPV
tara:strand:- start:1350 stop:2435 length:1086 start_codon:yes stop_codon:yes gene_type:complete